MNATLTCSGCGSSLSEHICPGSPPEVWQTLSEYVSQQERAYVSAAIAKCNGDRVKAADLLGISLATIYRKVPGAIDTARNTAQTPMQ